MAALTQILSSDLSLPLGSYIYKIVSTAPRQDLLQYGATDSLAVVSSDDALRCIDHNTLKILPGGLLTGVNKSVTCLERVDDRPGNILATAGRDGLIHFWDRRGNGKVMTIETRKVS
jgi:WD40 repeat protein